MLSGDKLTDIQEAPTPLTETAAKKEVQQSFILIELEEELRL